MSKTKQLTENQLILECQKIENRLNAAGEEFVLAKFDRGCLLKDTVMNEDRYGAGLMQTIAEELGYSDKTLYEEHAFAKRYNYDRGKLEAEIEGLKDKDRRISYSHFRKQLNPAKHPEVVGGIENHKDLTCRKMEDLAGEIEQAREAYTGDPQVEGAITASIETLVDMQEHAEFLVGDVLHPAPVKDLKVDLPHYLSWLRTHPCAITGTTDNIEAHHLILRSRGENSLDIFCLPLCQESHAEYHRVGHARFEAAHNVDLRVLCLGFIQEYIRTHKK